ncbi:GNAT family acetyltransferase, putative [Talaromyces stipitatus ATCC 10500]|uniref:GNAT family acetyltransferase, putative n=1 Tax=Talaromyces stipitatus (strain ATCC 10500 / CBS 375.48 / QM 6759 / NRRL 1006) TaxID=441959 RepID=B8LY85_TALSN|nr:GNAT family acetyltransferase, putative [Talaromyces stipitatus ATCC 10500]EED23330.1 GNAT family acetyltransferase, putative [Talaromyces stipitatus ATCC 10500]
MVIINLDKSNSTREKVKEPYIRLPAPHSHIIITSPRVVHTPQKGQQENEDIIPPESDIEAALTALNDDRVHKYLESPPYPYKREHALAFHRRMYDDTQRILQHPVPPPEDGEGEWLYDGCPFRDIRDTSLSPAAGAGTEEEVAAQAPKVGDIFISRYPFYELPVDSEQRKKAQEYNDSLPVGHVNLVWGLGFWLSPSHHRKGIMSAVLGTLITEWAIPRMNAQTIKSSAFLGNQSSVGVVQKCGFVLECTLEKASADMPEYKYGGGGRQDIVVLKWVRD